MSDLKRLLLDLFFPPRCQGCGRSGTSLCPDCKAKLPVIPYPRCARCSRHTGGVQICAHCYRHSGEGLHLDAILANYYFEGTLREMVHKLKYRGARGLAEPLALLLYEHLKAGSGEAEVIMPVPLHPTRLRERGYNQSALLARELGKLVGAPVVENAVERVRDTRAQMGLPAAERLENVRGSFVLTGQGLGGRRVLLVDDVCTTGATLDACATALKAGKAAAVVGIVLARAR